jgi:ribonuclease HI
MSPKAELPAPRAEIFDALAEGLEISDIVSRFGLNREELQALFQEAADYFANLDAGYWTIHCDGASRGNPGPAGAGAVVVDPSGNLRIEDCKFLGAATNNVAEYEALLLGLEAARRYGARKIQVFSDSELLVFQLTGRYRVRNPGLLALWQQAINKLKKFEAYAISHIDRSLNYEADRLANQAIDHSTRGSYNNK